MTSIGTAPSRPTIDPVTLEVVKNALGSLVDEMALIIMRTAYSGTVKDALDYSTGFCNAHGEIIAQGLGIALHLGSFPDAIGSVMAGYGHQLSPGDVFILNDPYGSGGIHLPDIYIIKPVFVDGGLEGFACSVAHHTDVGGIVPGSNASTATEIYQEGLRIPTLKLYERGQPVEAIFAIIAKNVRVPDKVLGDVRAQLAAVTSGERGYVDLARRYGVETLRVYCQELLEYSERLAREEIRALPDGTYRCTSYIDHDSVDPDPVRFEVALTIDDDHVFVDFEGTSPQVRGGINSPFPFSRSAVYAALRLAMDPSIPSSAGYFRPIDIRAAEGTVVRPVEPAACGARGITGFRIMDTVMGALAQAIPRGVPADGEGGNTLISIGGQRFNGERFVYVELFSGSRGASARGDGPEGVPHPGSNNANMPIEIAEVGFPLRFDAYGMVPDTGGPGEHRGALSLARQLRYLGRDTEVQIRSDKRRFPPFGLSGAGPGAPSSNLVNPGTPAERSLPTTGIGALRSGDTFRHQLAGGGGWGDPLARDPVHVQADLLDEKISVQHALDAYGVVADPVSRVVDPVATERLRAERRRSR